MSNSLPPADRDGEIHRAMLAINRCRAILSKASLSLEWQKWVVDCLIQEQIPEKSEKQDFSLDAGNKK